MVVFNAVVFTFSGLGFLVLFYSEAKRQAAERSYLLLSASCATVMWCVAGGYILLALNPELQPIVSTGYFRYLAPALGLLPGAFAWKLYQDRRRARNELRHLFARE